MLLHLSVRAPGCPHAPHQRAMPLVTVQVVNDEAVVPKKKKKDKTTSLAGEQAAPEGAQRAAAAARRAAPGSYDDMFRCVCQRPAACTPSVTSAMHTPPAQCWLNARTHRVVKARIPVKLMPSAISNVEDAVRRELTAMLLKLDPLLGGVPLTLSKLRIPAVSVPIFEDQPQLHFDVTCDFLLFAPQPGQMVPAVVNNVAEDAVRHARRAHTHAHHTNARETDRADPNLFAGGAADPGHLQCHYPACAPGARL